MDHYDEDLSENTFFHILQTEHEEIFRRATSEGWIICVPRAGCVLKYALTQDDIFAHILIPSDELPESHFRTLSGKEVTILNRVITIEPQTISPPYITHILFEETFYTDEVKYKVLCVENPLERQLNVAMQQMVASDVFNIHTLTDCIDFLWAEGAANILENIDKLTKSFVACNDNFEFEPLGSQKDIIGKLYTQCLQTALVDARLREKANSNKHYLENIKLSIETYMHHGIYKKVIKGITACTAFEDSHLNKIIRNLSDIQVRDLDIRCDLHNSVPWAKQELARIECYSTVLGKIGCLKRMISSLSQRDACSSCASEGNIITADDLLPIIVFLVIKAGLPNWFAHLTYLKEFHFSTSLTHGVDEYSFLITSLEAAIEHVKSGILVGPSVPEADVHCNLFGWKVSDEYAGEPNALMTDQSLSINNFLHQVRLSNMDFVKLILEKRTQKIDKPENGNVLQLCHPLCSCDKCEGKLSEHRCDATPSINSCDDRGFTALHVACLGGQAAMVDLLIEHGANVNATDYRSSTPLHYAAAKGHQNAVLLLLHSGAAIHVIDSDGNTPLHVASNNGHEGCAKALVYYAEHVGTNIDVNSTNNIGDTPLHHAARWGYKGIVQLLLEYGACPGIENKRHVTPFDYAHSLHISQLLMKVLNKNENITLVSAVSSCALRNSDVSVAAASKLRLDFSDAQQSSVKTTNKHSEHCLQLPEQVKKVEKLLRAIAHGDIQLACFYLGLDDPSMTTNLNILLDVNLLCHPLCTCEKCRDLSGLEENEIFKKPPRTKKLINVNVCNSEGFTPLHVAAMHGQTKMVQLLLDSGAKTNMLAHARGVTPLHLACQNQRLSVVELLLQTGDCDVNLQDIRGNTPLHYACYTGNHKLVKCIFKYFPHLNLRNANGKTPAEEAEENMFLSIAIFLNGNTKSENFIMQMDKSEV